MPSGHPPPRERERRRGQVGAGPRSFGTEEDYAAFLLPRLHPGTRLVAVAGERQGDRGPFISCDGSSKPLLVDWEDLEFQTSVPYFDVVLEVTPHTLTLTQCSPSTARTGRDVPLEARGGPASPACCVAQGAPRAIVMVSGATSGGMSCVPHSGGAPLGPEGARRLAGLLREATPLLTSLDLR